MFIGVTYLHCIFVVKLYKIQSTKWWNSNYVVGIERHAFFIIKASCRNIELRVKCSYVFNTVPYGI